MASADRQRLTAGIILVLVGAGFLLLQRVETVGEELVLLLIGSAFLVAYFYQRAYGLLVPAGILLGIAVGKLLQDRFWWANEAIPLGLGVGFLAIYVIARIYQGVSHWWPLIPGVILVLVGLPRTTRVFRLLLENWPLVLIAIGVVVIFAAFRGRGDERDPAPPAPSPAPAEPSEPHEPRVE